MGDVSGQPVAKCHPGRTLIPIRVHTRWAQGLFSVQYRLLFYPSASLQRRTSLTALASGGKGRRDPWR